MERDRTPVHEGKRLAGEANANGEVGRLELGDVVDGDEGEGSDGEDLEAKLGVLGVSVGLERVIRKNRGGRRTLSGS